MRRRDVAFLMAIYAVLSAITNFPSGFTNSSVNTAVEALSSFISKSYARRGWHLSDATQDLILSCTLNCWFFCQVFGALVAPFFVDQFGRKQGYIYGAAVTLASTIFQLVSIRLWLPEVLIIGRSLTALASPLCDACLILYLQETSPLEMRGAVSFFGEIGYGAMCVLGMLLGMRTVLGKSLEQLLISALLPELLSLVALFFIPETPKFLMITRNDRKAAKSALIFFQGERDDHEELLDVYAEERLMEAARGSSFKEVLSTWHIRRAVWLACSVLVLSLSFYPFLQSSTYFFLSIKIPQDAAEASSTLFMIVFTCSCMVGTYLIDRYPRRMLIITFGIISNMFLLVFAFLCSLVRFHPTVKYVALAVVFLYCISFGLVLGPISWFVAPELVSQRHRATVFSMCYAANNALITATNFATLPLYRLIGAWVFVPLFVLPSAACLVFIYHNLPEALGKQTHEIVAEIMASKPPRRRGERTPLIYRSP